MSLFIKNNIKTYHVHIPRTGGRFITQTFVQNAYQVLHCDDNLHLYGIECFHLHYPLYEYLEDVAESIQFAVIRNPIDRFKPELFTVAVKRNYNKEDLEKLESYDEFCYWIEYERMTAHYAKNWFRPQHEFIGPNTLIWKFEDGLTKTFRSWYYELTKDFLEDKEYSYWGDIDTELNPKRKEYSLSKNIIRNIEEYYKKNFEIFNY